MPLPVLQDRSLARHALTSVDLLSRIHDLAHELCPSCGSDSLCYIPSPLGETVYSVSCDFCGFIHRLWRSDFGQAYEEVRGSVGACIVVFHLWVDPPPLDAGSSLSDFFRFVSSHEELLESAYFTLQSSDGEWYKVYLLGSPYPGEPLSTVE